MKTINKYFFITALVLFTSIFFGCNYQADTPKNEVTLFVDKMPQINSYGYKYITPSEDLTKAFTTENIIYYINDEINFFGNTIAVGKNCVILFGDNGKITNGVISFNDTFLDGSVNFSNMRFIGTLINKTCKTSWFGFNNTTESENSALLKNATILSDVINCIGPNLIVDGFYPLSDMVTFTRSFNMMSPDWSSSCLTDSYNFTYEPVNGFYTNGGEERLFYFKQTYNINIYGLYFKGSPEKFMGEEVPKIGKENLSWAFILPNVGSLGSIYNCKIEGFTQGIRGVGGFIEKIQNTTFNACQVGLFFAWTSDFDVFGCKFTNCMPNLKIEDKPADYKYIQDDFNDIRHLGAGIWSCKGGMINFANNYYENNVIDFVANECDIIINVTDSVFKNPSFCSFYFYNDCARQQSPWQGLVPSELHKYAIDNFVVTGNTFELTENPKGKCLALIRETDMRYLGDSSGTPEQHGERGMNVIFSGNTINDSRTTVPDDDSIFAVSVADDTTGTITCSSNNFFSSKANYFVNVVPSQFKKSLGRIDPNNRYRDVYDYIDVTKGTFTFVNNGNTWGSTVTQNKANGNSSNFVVFK